MISHEHKCIFIHIPKCAGTSIEAALGHLDGHTGRGGQDHRSIRMLEQPCLRPQVLQSRENLFELLRRYKHNHVNRVANPRNKYVVTKEQYRSYYKFTVVRDPWARVYSWYKNVIRDELHQKELNITSDISFNEFVRKFGGKGKLKPQLYWLKAFDGSIPLDFIARFESLSNDMRIVFGHLGLSDTTLPHELHGSTGDFMDQYDAETAELVSTLYKEEIDLFGYSLTNS